MKIFKLTFALFILIFGPLSSVQAQEVPTSQPEQNYIQAWEQEIVFPGAIRFNIRFGLAPIEISEVSLTIQPETRPAITIPMNLAETVIVGGDITVVEYIWALPSANPPLLFRDIRLTWEATSADGQTARIDDIFTFTDERSGWLRDMEIGNNIAITIPNGAPTTSTATTNRAGINEFRSSLRQVSDLLTANLGTIPNFNLLIYDSTLPLCSENAAGELVALGYNTAMEVACNPTVANTIFADSGYALLQVQSTTLAAIENAVSNYVVSESYEQQWVGRDIPAWFKAGLIQFYSPALKTELGAPLFTAARTNSLLPLNVVSQEAGERINADLWQSESYGLVVYITSQIGIDGLFRLANNAASATSFAEAYASTVGKSLNSLLNDFERWLFTDAAISAFAFTPYQVATPSPTPSRTLTPTRTPLPTNTMTPTWTPTVTGVQTRTPLPSRTPTRTPTTAPATNTPRPAGSLNTATPTPATTSLADAAVNPNLTLGILILVVGAILVLITAIVLFRPKR